MSIRLKNPRTAILLSTLMLAFVYAGASYGSDGSDGSDKSADSAELVRKAAEKTPEAGIADKTSEYLRDYLSDPRRTGSMAGTILGGAMFAHPAGPIVGSMIGFFIGKSSMFNEDKNRELKASQLYVKRDIVPQSGQGQALPTLSFANTQGISFDTPAAAKVSEVSTTPSASLPVINAPAAAKVSEVSTTPSASLPVINAPAAAKVSEVSTTPSANLPVINAPAAVKVSEGSTSLSPGLPVLTREQIAAACGGKTVTDPRFRALCFYSQGS